MQPLQQLYTCNHGLMYRVIFLTKRLFLSNLALAKKPAQKLLQLGRIAKAVGSYGVVSQPNADHHVIFYTPLGPQW